MLMPTGLGWGASACVFGVDLFRAALCGLVLLRHALTVRIHWMQARGMIYCENASARHVN